MIGTTTLEQSRGGGGLLLLLLLLLLVLYAAHVKTTSERRSSLDVFVPREMKLSVLQLERADRFVDKKKISSLFLVCQQNGREYRVVTPFAGN